MAAETGPPDDQNRPGPVAAPPNARPSPVPPAGAGPADGGPSPGPAGASAAAPLPHWLSAAVRLMRSRAVRVGFLAVVLVLLAFALDRQAGTLWHDLQRLSVPVVVLAFALCLGGLIGSLMVWREMLADLGSRLSVPDAWRVMFIGQLGKYVPGSIWPVLAQSELGADHGVPRSRSALSVLLSYAVMTLSGAVVAMVTLPFATASSVAQYFWIIFLVPVAVVLLSPPVLNRLLRFVLRVSRQPALGQSVSFKGLGRTMVWAVAAWTLNGAMIYVLMRQLAGHQQGTLLVSIGAYALSWVVGFVAVFAPAGAGVREVVMVAVLSTRTTPATALTVALVSRALGVMADAATGAAASALVGRRRLRRLRGTSGPPAPPPGADADQVRPDPQSPRATQG
jgi:glycosyltransferase 2 family protein